MVDVFFFLFAQSDQITKTELIIDLLLVHVVLFFLAVQQNRVAMFTEKSLKNLKRLSCARLGCRRREWHDKVSPPRYWEKITIRAIVLKQSQTVTYVPHNRSGSLYSIINIIQAD